MVENNEKNYMFNINIMCIDFNYIMYWIQKLDKIRATDYFSGIECTIPLEIPSGAMTSEFLHTDDNIDEIKAKLDDISSEEGNFTVEDLPYDALLIVYTENSKMLYIYFKNIN